MEYKEHVFLVLQLILNLHVGQNVVFGVDLAQPPPLSAARIRRFAQIHPMEGALKRLDLLSAQKIAVQIALAPGQMSERFYALVLLLQLCHGGLYATYSDLLVEADRHYSGYVFEQYREAHRLKRVLLATRDHLQHVAHHQLAEVPLDHPQADHLLDCIYHRLHHALHVGVLLEVVGAHQGHFYRVLEEVLDRNAVLEHPLQDGPVRAGSKQAQNPLHDIDAVWVHYALVRGYYGLGEALNCGDVVDQPVAGRCAVRKVDQHEQVELGRGGLPQLVAQGAQDELGDSLFPRAKGLGWLEDEGYQSFEVGDEERGEKLG